MAQIRVRTWARADGTTGRAYRLRFRDEEGRWRERLFPTRQAAVDARESVDAMAEARRASGSRSDLTVEQAVALWLDACATIGLGGREPVEAHTLRAYKSEAAHILARPIAEEQAADLKRADIRSFRDTLLGELSRDRARRVLARLHAALEECVERDLLPNNPAAGVRIRASRRHRQEVAIPTPAEVAAILKAADRLANGHFRLANRHASAGPIVAAWRRYRPLIYLARYTGLRPSEIRGLPWSAVDVAAGAVQVRQRADEDGAIGPPKSAAGRRKVPLPPPAAAALRLWVWRGHRPHGDLVFGTSSDRPEDLANIHRRCWTRVLELADVDRPDLTLYSLRHYYASEMIARGRDWKRIQRRLGHESFAMTMDIYGHLIDDEDLDQADGAAVG